MGCYYCEINTAGQHAFNCPNSPIVLSYEENIDNSDKLCPIGLTNSCGYWAKLQAESKRLREAFEKYADHDSECKIRRGIYGTYLCDCGFEQALKGE